MWRRIFLDLHIEKQIIQHTKLVDSVVYKMNITLPSGLDEKDMFSYGLEGLYKAIKTFDESKGSFMMYAKCKIRNQIIDSIRAYSTIPRSVLDKKKRVNRAKDELQNSLGRIPTKEEMMSHMGLDEKKYKKHLEAFNYGTDFSINDVFQNSSDELEEFFETDNGNYLEKVQREELKKYLIDAIKNMDERSKTVMFLRYYQNCTYKEIAAVMNISESTVGEIHNRTIICLREKAVQDEMN